MLQNLFTLGVGIFFVVIAYRKAKQSGRKPIRWAAIAAATFIGAVISFATVIGVVLSLGRIIWGWSRSLAYNYNSHITIAVLLASGFTTWLVLRPLNKVPDKSFDEPPPPPTFESSEN